MAQALKRLPLAACKIYISDSRNALALRQIESTFSAHPEAPLLHTFEDVEYNRVGYTLAGKSGVCNFFFFPSLQYETI